VGPAAQLAQVALGLFLGPCLAEDPAVEEDLRVAAEYQVAFDRLDLAAGILDDHLARVALGQLLDVRGLDVELDAQLLEDRAPLGRRARED
jgi:hypothetical protein